VKVVDFGIAKFFAGPQALGAERLTQVGEYLGTPRFIAPERVLGGPDDGRSDVYSLGALLYELICAASPWTRQQEAQIADGLPPDGGAQPMHRFRRGVPPELERLARQALSWDAADRPAAWELAAGLLALVPSLDDSPVAGARPEPRDLEDTALMPAARLTD
jgi:serine/threonine protein kinase